MQAFTGRDLGRDAGALQLRPRGGGDPLLPHPRATARSPLVFHFNGSVFYGGEDGGLQIVQIPWDAVGRLQDAGRGLEADDRRSTTPTATGSPLQRDTIEALRAAQGRSAGCRPTTHGAGAARGGEGERAVTRRSRGPGRLAALRGLRALPLHARGDQERDADPVRDRLPARVRRGCSPRLRHRRGSTACCDRRGRDAR